jgi:hypothetical protein
MVLLIKHQMKVNERNFFLCILCCLDDSNDDESSENFNLEF